MIIKMILSCSNLRKIDSSKNSPFLLVVMLDVVLKARTSRSFDAMNQHLREGQLDQEDCISLCPSVFLPHDLNLGTRFLFSGGELSHP